MADHTGLGLRIVLESGRTNRIPKLSEQRQKEESQFLDQIEALITGCAGRIAGWRDVYRPERLQEKLAADPAKATLAGLRADLALRQENFATAQARAVRLVPAEGGGYVERAASRPADAVQALLDRETRDAFRGMTENDRRSVYLDAVRRGDQATIAAVEFAPPLAEVVNPRDRAEADKWRLEHSPWAGELSEMAEALVLREEVLGKADEALQELLVQPAATR